MEIIKKDLIVELIKKFSETTHGSSSYDKDSCYVMGESYEFAPFSYLSKKLPAMENIEQLFKIGYIYSSYNFVEVSSFSEWFEQQFSKKLTLKASKKISILYIPDQITIFNSVEQINRGYDRLREEFILLNSKNLPVQLGEWYAKCIFGLVQIKSSSQRSFDFMKQGKTIEVKVHWADKSSPKGVKLKKSAVEISNWVVIMYIAQNLMIRDICFLDSEFIKRKFFSKGHTMFLKDIDVHSYFFSKSCKHFDKISNRSALMRFASPNLAMKLDGRFEDND